MENNIKEKIIKYIEKSNMFKVYKTDKGWFAPIIENNNILHGFILYQPKNRKSIYVKYSCMHKKNILKKKVNIAVLDSNIFYGIFNIKKINNINFNINLN